MTFLFGSSQSPPVSVAAERWDFLMGTVVQQHVYGIAGERCTELAAGAIADLEQLWSVFRPDSEVSRLTRGAGGEPLAVAPETLAILGEARRLHQVTHGALDVTTRPITQLWKRAADCGHLPTVAEIAVARQLVDASDIELHAERARLRRAGQQLDLGAIGKGFAADRCVALYRREGIRFAFVDLGGNVALLGGKPDGSPWRVGIQAPSGKRGEYIGVVEARDCAIVTSGHYERGYQVGESSYSHIIDPRTGMPVDNGVLSVTVMHPSSLLADAYATACVVLGVERAVELARAQALDVLIIHTGGRVLTPGMARVFQPL
ncbi:MAG: FAD:protein FMN transferase [Polyangiales bacterium]